MMENEVTLMEKEIEKEVEKEDNTDNDTNSVPSDKSNQENIENNVEKTERRPMNLKDAPEFLITSMIKHQKTLFFFI